MELDVICRHKESHLQEVLFGNPMHKFTVEDLGYDLVEGPLPILTVDTTSDLQL